MAQSNVGQMNAGGGIGSDNNCKTSVDSIMLLYRLVQVNLEKWICVFNEMWNYLWIIFSDGSTKATGVQSKLIASRLIILCKVWYDYVNPIVQIVWIKL